MILRAFHRSILVGLGVLLSATVSAQTLESVGPRAQGMGGAFVAVASDATASWWNPAGLAAGPFFDAVLAFDQAEPSLSQRDTASVFAIGTPPLGISRYRTTVSSAAPSGFGEGAGASREAGGDVSLRRLDVTQWGVTLVQTLAPGLHVGTTLKYVQRASVTDTADASLSASRRLELAEALDGGSPSSRFDLDIGLLGAYGPLRLGFLGRNLRETGSEEGEPVPPRQFRVGGALDLERLGGPHMILSLDADIRGYDAVRGKRQLVAVGAEQWFLDSRLGVRGGARMNRVGAKEWALTTGGSVRVATATYVEGYFMRGRSDDDRGWGLSARVSY